MLKPFFPLGLGYYSCDFLLPALWLFSEFVSLSSSLALYTNETLVVSLQLPAHSVYSLSIFPPIYSPYLLLLQHL